MKCRYSYFIISFSLICLFLLKEECKAQWIRTNILDSVTVPSLTAIGDTIFAVTNQGKVYRSADNGDNWFAADSGLPSQSATRLIAKGEKIFAGTAGSGVFVSTNRGDSWHTANNGISDLTVFNIGVHGNLLMVAAQGTQIYYSINEGLNWSITSPCGPSGYTLSNVTANDSCIFAGVVGGVATSTNGGTSWTTDDLGLTSSAQVSALLATGQFVLAGGYCWQWLPHFVSYNGIYRSSDNGRNWEKRSPEYCTALGAVGDIIFAGIANQGVLRSLDHGLTWTSMGSGIYPNCFVSNSTYLFLGAIGGVWKAPLSTMTSVPEETTLVPSKYCLEQNYPNPFNSTTTIRFHVPHESVVKISILDILGREISTILNQDLMQGIYERSYDASTLASGIYFLRLESAEIVQTKKMLLLR